MGDACSAPSVEVQPETEPPPADPSITFAVKDRLIYAGTNNNMKIKLFIKLNDLEGKIDVLNGMDYGWVTDPPRFAKINPRGLLPVLETVINGKQKYLAESQLILEYIADKYKDDMKLNWTGETLAERFTSSAIMQFAQLYITANAFTGGHNTQKIFYGPALTGGGYERKMRYKDLSVQLDRLEDTIDPTGPMAAGPRMTYSDIVFWPTVHTLILLGGGSGAPNFASEAVFFEKRPKMKAWYKYLLEQKAFQEAAKELDEMFGPGGMSEQLGLYSSVKEAVAADGGWE